MAKDNAAVKRSLTHTKQLPGGSINLQELSLVSENTSKQLDLRNMISELNIFEDVRMPFISVSLIMTDSLALSSWFPIVGQEKIKLKFVTPHPSFTKDVQLELQVVGIEKFKAANVRTERFIIRAVTKEAIRDWNTKVRKSYQEMPVSDMVQSLYDDYISEGSEIEISPTEGNRTIVIPNMTPSKAMGLLARNAMSERYPSSNFVFFQTVEKFHFITLDQLIEAKDDDRLEIVDGKKSKSAGSAKDQYFVTDMDLGNSGTEIQDLDVGPAFRKRPFDFTKILNFEFVNLFNHRRTLRAGGYEGTLRVFDPVMSLYTESKWNYHESFDKLAKTYTSSANPVISELNPYIRDGEGRTEMIITDESWNTSAPDMKARYLLQQNASFALLDNLTVDLTVAGDSSRRIGDTIDLQFPEFGATDEQIPEVNKFISGEYVVVSNRYMYTPGGFYTVMRCCKNAYEKSVEDKSQSFFSASSLTRTSS